jgi:hypothetical protein
MAEQTKSSPPAAWHLKSPPLFLAARALVVKKHEDRETGPAAPQEMADFCDPFFGERPWYSLIES